MNSRVKLVLKGVVGISTGAAIGLAVSLLSRYTGSGWTITCQPMVMVLLGAFVGLMMSVKWNYPLGQGEGPAGWAITYSSAIEGALIPTL